MIVSSCAILGGEQLRADLVALGRDFDSEVPKLIDQLCDQQLVNMMSRAARREGVDGAIYPATKNAKTTTLHDTGAMLTSIRRLGSRGGREAEIGPSDALSSQKLHWHHYGTGTWGPRGAPYEIKPKPGHKALSFPSSGAAESFSNSVRVGSRNSRKGQQFYSIAKFSRGTAGRRVTTGMTTVASVMHPGVQPRPLFGISESDETKLVGAADKWEDALLGKRGLA